MAKNLEYGGGNMKVISLAGPDTAPTTHGITVNIARARRYAIELWKEGWAVICPHMNSAHLGGALIPETRFLRGGLLMLTRCDAMAVMPNYEYSMGTLAEITQAEMLGIDIIYLEEIE